MRCDATLPVAAWCGDLVRVRHRWKAAGRPTTKGDNHVVSCGWVPRDVHPEPPRSDLRGRGTAVREGRYDRVSLHDGGCSRGRSLGGDVPPDAAGPGLR